jgi:hypothetical protein
VATRDLESIGGKNGFALIFVESCHGCVLFRIKMPNVQPACAQGYGAARAPPPTASASKHRAETYVPGSRTVIPGLLDYRELSKDHIMVRSACESRYVR